MLPEIKHRLARVRQRERRLRSVHWFVRGWLIGAALALVAAVLWRAGVGVTWWTPWAAVAAGAASAYLFGLAAPLPWQQTAARVDEHYKLKDRSTTALQFAVDDRGDLLRKLQVADATDRLADIDPHAVLPWQRPRWLFASLIATTCVTVIMLLPVEQPAVAGVPTETRELLDEQATYLEETMLDELRELAEDEDQDIDELVEELEELVDELRDPATDTRDALAKLSRMQQSITAAMAQFNLEQVDSAMQSVASAIEPAQPLQPVAADLRAQDYEKAAEKLEKVDPNKLSNREKRTVADNLKKLASNLGKANQGQLSEATGALAQGLEKKNDSQCKEGTCKLARLCRAQSLRKSIGRCLGNQLNRLSMCKGQCNKNGGKGIAKSDRPSNNWGTGKTDKPLGDEATNLDSGREQVNVSGAHGEGPSEREVISSAEAEQLAARGYKARYAEFRRQAEAVLESEPLPLGHRETVRKYFENIRPASEDTE